MVRGKENGRGRRGRQREAASGSEWQHGGGGGEDDDDIGEGEGEPEESGGGADENDSPQPERRLSRLKLQKRAGRGWLTRSRAGREYVAISKSELHKYHGVGRGLAVVAGFALSF